MIFIAPENAETKLFYESVHFFQTNIPGFQKSEFSVVRQHEEFVWLHDRFDENEEYAGYIVSLLKTCKKRSYLITYELFSIFYLDSTRPTTTGFRCISGKTAETW